MKCSGRNEFFTQAVESCARWECHFTAAVPEGRGAVLRVELWLLVGKSYKHMSWRYTEVHLT